MAIPTRITAGTAQSWEYSLSDYPPSAGYTSDVYLRSGAEVISLVATDDGSSYTAAATSAVTADWKPGNYTVYVYAILSGERYLACSLAMSIAADPMAADTTSQWETDLAAVDEAIRQKIAKGAVASIQIQTVAGSRQLENMPLLELREHRAWLQEKVDAERRAKGLPTSGGYRKIKMTFSQ